MAAKLVEVSLIETTHKNKPLKSIIETINTYLIRNRGGVSDFNLMRDIVERNTESLDEEINSQIPIPLYLGLMGTMLGIIIGLFFIPTIDSIVGTSFAVEDRVTIPSTGQQGVITQLNGENEAVLQLNDGSLVVKKKDDLSKPSGVDILLGGVKIAMISSFIGLLLTVLLSGWFYKRARIRAEANKNVFYTFLQTELLPVISSDTATVMRTLERSLNNFNIDFGVNANKFHESFGNFSEVVIEMGSISSDFKNLMGEIRKMNLLKLSKVNAELLNRISVSAQGFDKFNRYLEQIDAFIDQATRLNETLLEQLYRTGSIEDIASTIKTNVEQNQKIIEYLDTGLMEIETRKQVFHDSVIDIDESLRKSLEALEQHTQESINAIKNITIKEEDLLEGLLQKDRGNLDQLKNLDAVKLNLDKMIQQGADQAKALASLTSAMKEFAEKKEKLNEGYREDEPRVLEYMKYAVYGTGAIIGSYIVVTKLADWSAKLFQVVIGWF
jgi:hypothetical protein